MTPGERCSWAGSISPSLQRRVACCWWDALISESPGACGKRAIHGRQVVLSAPLVPYDPSPLLSLPV
ncbi:hypothetical protein DPEC_G00050140 [Dallia pectoralis]|uniref:Uncharacterized protein n=1 Tax=Dallia pectoralis TaxID=75939 RepID=A0ACC2HAW5_DALPE|nr:hypothetical protein DPEC_G00050140 [Dallia pectoralis]